MGAPLHRENGAIVAGPAWAVDVRPTARLAWDQIRDPPREVNQANLDPSSAFVNGLPAIRASDHGGTSWDAEGWPHCMQTPFMQPLSTQSSGELHDSPLSLTHREFSQR